MKKFKRLTALLMALMLLVALPAMGALAATSNEITVTPGPEGDATPTPQPEQTPDVDAVFTLSKAVDNPAPMPGDVVIFTISVINNASEAQTGVTVTDPVPEGLILDAESISDGGVWQEGAVTWTFDIEAGATRTMTMSCTVPENAQAGATYVNTAALGDLTASATVTVSQFSLQLICSVDERYPQPGAPVKYTVALENTDDMAALGVEVTDQVPEGMSIDASSISDGGAYQEGTISWAIDLEPGEVKKLTFVAYVPEDAKGGDKFVNTANAGELSSTATVMVYEPTPELRLKMKVNNPTPESGALIKYTITVTNKGDGDALDVKVVDTLPDELEVSRSTISHDGSYRSSDHSIVWYVDVPKGEQVALTFKAYVPDDAEDGDVYVNRAHIQGIDSAKAKVWITEDAVPKTGYGEGDTVVPAPVPVEAAPRAEETEEPEPAVAEDFNELIAQNPDTVGVLKAGDGIDLPVVKRDNQYYMNHAFDGSENEAGTLFLDERNSQWPRDAHLLIYGHNMKDGSMLGTMQNYREVEYLKAHPVIEYRTLYDVQSAYYVPVAVLDASMTPEDADYLKIRRPNFDSEEDMQAFVASQVERSYFNLPFDVAAEDQLVSLVTCSYFQDNGRLIVLARKLRADETVESVTALMNEQAQKK